MQSIIGIIGVGKVKTDINAIGQSWQKNINIFSFVFAHLLEYDETVS